MIIMIANIYWWLPCAKYCPRCSTSIRSSNSPTTPWSLVLLSSHFREEEVEAKKWNNSLRVNMASGRATIILELKEEVRTRQGNQEAVILLIVFRATGLGELILQGVGLEGWGWAPKHLKYLEKRESAKQTEEARGRGPARQMRRHESLEGTVSPADCVHCCWEGWHTGDRKGAALIGPVLERRKAVSYC